MSNLRSVLGILAVLLVISLSGCAPGKVAVSELRDGDLLFVVNGAGNNITNVTEGVDGLGIDHVAIYADGCVIEAVPEHGVRKFPLDAFLAELADDYAVMVGRVVGMDVDASIANAEAFLGKPYDDIFMPGDSAIYCSELVQKSYAFLPGTERCPNTGKVADSLVFPTIPMSFHDSTGRVTEFWTGFYAARGMEVPEGEPGTNPGQLSRDPGVRILGTLSYDIRSGR